MRCFKTVKGFSNAVCREKGLSAPHSLCFIVEHTKLGIRLLAKCPHWSPDIKRIVCCVDKDRYAERRFGVWVEVPGPIDEAWLLQWQLAYAVERLKCQSERSKRLVAPRHVDPEVQRVLNRYIVTAQAEFNDLVTERVEELLTNDGRFRLIEKRGDPTRSRCV